MLPNQTQVTEHLSKLGVGLSKPVVCYDQGNGMWSCRAAFVLKVWGFDEVSVLDGGFSGWGDHQVESGEGNVGNDTNFNFVYHPELVADYE